MFRILIAEDEPPIRRMLQAMLKAADPAFSETQVCMNGREAVKCLEKEDFDIVFTDIKMPVMTGLELAEWIYHNKPETMVIIISGYSDFDYAHKALEYKVFDYLLKPVSKEHLADLTRRIRAEFGKRSIKTVVSGDENSTLVMLACAGAYLLYGAEVLLPGERFWADSDIERLVKEHLHADEEYLFFNTNMLSERFLVISSEHEERQAALAKSIYEAFSGGDLPVTLVYKKGVPFKEAGASFALLREQLIKRLVPGKAQLLCIDDALPKEESAGALYTKEEVEALKEAIQSGRAEQVKPCLGAVLDRMQRIDATEEDLNNFLNVVLDSYALDYPTFMERNTASVRREFINALAGFTGYEALKEDVSSILLSLRSDSKTSDRYVHLADKIEAYLSEHYQEDITSETLSKEFGFVPSYLSRLFKRHKGVSPNEYITRFRIRMAKKLILERPELRIKEIADLVGFREAYYFSKTFKRETGLWPTEFVSASGKEAKKEKA